jgi:transcriptional regulator with XRE-family HTH domain
MHIGEVIRHRREEQDLTGFQLAVKAGMSPSAVSQIETGKRVPSSASVVKLAGALGVEVGELYPKAQSPLPFEDNQLMDRPEIQEWLREHGHMTVAEFLEWAEDLEAEIDDEGIPRGVEEGIEALRDKRDELLAALRTSEARKALFPVPPGLSREEKSSWLRKPPGRWELRNDIRHEYLARELALVNASRRLFREGKTSGYLVYSPSKHDHERHRKLLEERRRVLRESYEKAVAV